MLQDGELSQADALAFVEELHEYLSDSRPPVLVAQPVGRLITARPALCAQAIFHWSAQQLRLQQEEIELADLLFHALKKLQLLAEFGLVESASFEIGFGALCSEVIDQCPDEDRELLRQHLKHLYDPIAKLWRPVDVLRLSDRPEAAPRIKPGRGGGAGGGGGGSGVGRKKKRDLLSHLPPLPEAAQAEPESTQRTPQQVAEADFDRLMKRAEDPGVAEGSVERERLASELVGAAALSSQDLRELKLYFERLRSAGMSGIETGKALRMLTQRLPDLHVAGKAAESAGSSGTIRAMENLVRIDTGGDGELANLREIVEAGVAQFNSGSVGRAVTVIQLARRMLDKSRVPRERRTELLDAAAQRLDLSRVKELAKEPSNRRALRYLLSFLPRFELRSLLDRLYVEEVRAERYKLLELIQIYEDEARDLVADELIRLATPDRPSGEWYVQRNLLHLLRRIPPGERGVHALELDSVTTFSMLGNAYQVQREALLCLGASPEPTADLVLGERLVELLYAGMDEKTSDADRDEIAQLQVLVLGQLLRRDSSEARCIALDHILKDKEWQDAYTGLLRGLGSVDLSNDTESLERLTTAIRARLPRRVLGFTLPAWPHRKAVEGMVVALSSSPVLSVREVLDEVIDRCSGRPVGGVAKGIRDQLEEISLAGSRTHGPKMTGDLEIFGLASLLQTLEINETTGVLTIQSKEPPRRAATIRVFKGQFVDARYEHLRGLDAFYALFQKPFKSTFEVEREEGFQAPAKQPQEMTALLLESHRRTDELEHLRVLLPDHHRLRRGEESPSPPPGEEDGALLHEMWQFMERGMSPASCEDHFEREPYRLRSILVHWAEQGAIIAEAPPQSFGAKSV